METPDAVEAELQRRLGLLFEQPSPSAPALSPASRQARSGQQITRQLRLNIRERGERARHPIEKKALRLGRNDGAQPFAAADSR